jgi:hypothetical protein
MFDCSFVAHRKITSYKYKYFLIFQNTIFRKPKIFSRLRKFEFYFRLIGESVEKIWLRFSAPGCHHWVVSPGMSPLHFSQIYKKKTFSRTTDNFKFLPLLKIFPKPCRVRKSTKCNWVYSQKIDSNTIYILPYPPFWMFFSSFC